jgi:hypothetical protein
MPFLLRMGGYHMFSRGAPLSKFRKGSAPSEAMEYNLLLLRF